MNKRTKSLSVVALVLVIVLVVLATASQTDLFQGKFSRNLFKRTAIESTQQTLTKVATPSKKLSNTATVENNDSSVILSSLAIVSPGGLDFDLDNDITSYERTLRFEDDEELLVIKATAGDVDSLFKNVKMSIGAEYVGLENFKLHLINEDGTYTEIDADYSVDLVPAENGSDLLEEIFGLFNSSLTIIGYVTASGFSESIPANSTSYYVFTADVSAEGAEGSLIGKRRVVMSIFKSDGRYPTYRKS